MTLRWVGLALASVVLAACVMSGPVMPVPSQADLASLDALEQRSGGRLGVALIDAQGRALLAHRPDERFAMCSTFKLLLAAMVLDRHDKGGPKVDTPLVIERSQLVPYSPAIEKRLAGADRGEVTALDAAAAAVTISDNSAANLLLALYGGPDELTRWLRGHGDAVTRLDRIEPDLNENTLGDPRDTTSPAAMAESARDALLAGTIAPPLRAKLTRWMIESTTGAARIRAGLPSGWTVGDKTGTCGTAFNDVALFINDRGQHFLLAVYLDRPTVDGDGANRVIADVARLAARTVNRATSRQP